MVVPLPTNPAARRPPVLVVFDLGRVLVRIADDLDDAARRAGRRGLPGFRGDLSAHTRRGGTPRVAELLSAYETGRVSNDGYLDGLAEATGAARDDLAAVHDVVLIAAFRGAAELLNDLRQQPVRTACFSNTNALHWARMRDPADPAAFGLHRLDHRFASHQINHAKPDAAAYHYVESATRVPPGEILFFDDLEENVAAAAARGWRAERVTVRDNPVPWLRQRLSAAGVLP